MANVPKAKELFDQASEILGYDLLQVCVEGALPIPAPPPLLGCGLVRASSEEAFHAMNLVVEWSSDHLKSIFTPQRLSSFGRGSTHAGNCNELPH